MSNSENATKTTDTVSVIPFGCMTRYFESDASTMSVEDSTMLAMMYGTKAKLNTKKYTDTLDHEIECVLAMHRLTQFGIRFDSFKGQKVHMGPSLRSCGCNDEHDQVIYAGCKECCITWPDEVPQCECDERFLCDSDFVEVSDGCMHPGDFDQISLDAFWDEHDMCLICLHDHSNGEECKHQPLYSDLCLLHGTGAWDSGNDNSDKMKSMLSKDAALKIKLDERERKRKADEISV
ncbi:hypothetical protein T484DRAFT_1757652 [Baffinella frigidus]|nr:hypothetical protein T484DRAFT_1757652 [Cryptophyta sp. CCMP2293]